MGGESQIIQTFRTTHWSLVLAAGHERSPNSAAALQKLCEDYWYPLYAYVRRNRYSVEDAQDLTQEFFYRLLHKDYLALANPAKGRFRTFLLTAFNRFLISEWRRARAAKRTGDSISIDLSVAEARYQIEPVSNLTPERIYEKRWAASVLERVLQQLQEESVHTAKRELFDSLKALLWGDKETVSYAELSETLGVSQGSLRIAAMRLRERFRELLIAEVAQTVSDSKEISEEINYLLAALSTRA